VEEGSRMMHIDEGGGDGEIKNNQEGKKTQERDPSRKKQSIEKGGAIRTEVLD